MRRAVLTASATVESGGEGARDALVDANRLRRLDRFGRSAVVAGGRVLAAAGVGAARPGAAPDPRFGVVVGTAYGCRDAVTNHARLLARAARVEDLAPSVFVATVHNAAGGELAIFHGLGGVAETLVSGRTAGLEALALAARRVADGDADRILVVAAEGIDGTLRAAWERANPGGTLVESAAAVLVEAQEGEEEGKGEERDSLSKRGEVLFVGASLTFDAPTPRGASEEHEDFLEGVSEGEARDGDVAVMERPGAARPRRPGAPPVERLGASGLWEIATDVAAVAATRRARPERRAEECSPSKKTHRYVVRDVHGTCAALTLAFFS